MNDWMKNIPSDYLVSEINLPGTHDSCAQYIRFSHISRCQSKSVTEQLNMGIRLLDIRVKFDGEKLKICHSFLNCKKDKRKKEDLLFDDVLKSCKDFLMQNPTETILMIFKREAGKNEEATYDYFYNTFVKNSEFFYTRNKVPSLASVRGKIVLLNRCGANVENAEYSDENSGINLSGWPYQNSRKDAVLQKVAIPERSKKSEQFFYLQDFFNLNPKKKWELAVLPTIQNTPQDKAMLFNFFSGSNFFSSPKRYKRIIFKRFFSLELMPMKKYGWFVLDFPNKKIIKKIILTNY